jgi:hypothetical protein
MWNNVHTHSIYSQDIKREFSHEINESYMEKIEITSQKKLNFLPI